MLDVLAGRPEGAPRGELQELAGLQGLDPQVVRRLLADLLRQGSLRVEGATRCRRYFLGHGAKAPVKALPADDDLPLSPEGRACRNLLARPLSQRPPVSHSRSFLDAYQPGATFYLSATLRRRMAALGGSGRSGCPGGVHRRQFVDLAWNSSRLEGNRCTFAEAERLIEDAAGGAGRHLLETQMILNHMAALQYLEEASDGLAPDPATVQNLHALLMENLVPNPMDEGGLRVTPKRLRGSSYVPTAVPQTIEEGFRQIFRIAGGIDDPYEQSFFLLVHLLYLQPFLDGCERTARLAANVPLIGRNCLPVTFSGIGAADFSEGMLAVCELNRVDLLRDIFVYAFERAGVRAEKTSPGVPDPFRWRYRAAIKRTVREVVLGGHPAPEAGVLAQAFADSGLPQEVRARFQRVVESELAGLHEGNLARYQLRPAEFSQWRRATRPPEAGG